jgi:hypothetical protein
LKIRREIRSSRCTTGVLDIGGKWKKSSIIKVSIILFGHLCFAASIVVVTTLAKLVAKFAAGVVDTGGKFAAGVFDTSDTGGAS